MNNELFQLLFLNTMRKWFLISSAIFLPVFWTLFEWGVLSFFLSPISWGWWGLFILIILSWFLSSTHLWIAGISLAVGYEALSIHPLGVTFFAIAGVLIWTLFLEKQIFVRYSFTTLLLSVASGMAIFTVNYLLLLSFLRILFPRYVLDLSVVQLSARSGFMIIVYIVAGLIFYLCRAIVQASFTRYFFSRRFE